MEMPSAPQKLGICPHAIRFPTKVFDAIVDPLIVVDADFCVESLNLAACDMFPKDARLALGMQALEAFTHQGISLSKSALMVHVRQNGRWTGEVLYTHAEKNTLGQLTISQIMDDDNVVVQYVVSFRDISERVQAKQRIEELAYTDMLTGLPNRLRLMERLARMLPLAKRRGESFAVVFLDLD